MDERRAIAWLCCLLVVSPVLASALATVVPGIGSYAVTSGSMAPSIPAGALVFVVEATEYQQGDVITYTHDGERITHRVVDHSTGTVRTQGDANDSPDDWSVDSGAIEGRVVLTVPHYGSVLVWIRSPVGHAVTVLLPGIALVGIYARRLREELG